MRNLLLYPQVHKQLGQLVRVFTLTEFIVIFPRFVFLRFQWEMYLFLQRFFLQRTIAQFHTNEDTRTSYCNSPMNFQTHNTCWHSNKQKHIEEEDTLKSSPTLSHKSTHSQALAITSNRVWRLGQVSAKWKLVMRDGKREIVTTSW